MKIFWVIWPRNLSFEVKIPEKHPQEYRIGKNDIFCSQTLNFCDKCSKERCEKLRFVCAYHFICVLSSVPLSCFTSENVIVTSPRTLTSTRTPFCFSFSSLGIFCVVFVFSLFFPIIISFIPYIYYLSPSLFALVVSVSILYFLALSNRIVIRS